MRNSRMIVETKQLIKTRSSNALEKKSFEVPQKHQGRILELMESLRIRPVEKSTLASETYPNASFMDLLEMDSDE